ncbi:hypothetical protein HRbin15_01074 [bacterium HR15]|nr:hypothetical protein HRbin15_01074 [bacterium HR15]
MRVYSRAMGGTSWSSVEDYLPAGNALGYSMNWQYRHTGGKWLMRGQISPGVLSHVAACAAAARRAALNAMEMCRRDLRPFHCDKLGHCVGACTASRCGGQVLAWCLGWFKELAPGPGWLDPHAGRFALLLG